MGNHGLDFTKLSAVFGWTITGVFVDAIYASTIILKKKSAMKVKK